MSNHSTSFLESISEEPVQLSDLQETYPKLNLKEFFLLEKYRKEFSDAIIQKDSSKLIHSIKCILKLQTKKDIELKSLAVTLRDILIIFGANRITADVVFMKPSSKPEKHEKQVYDFDNRWMVQWIDLLARNYHWALSEIYNLSVNTVLFLIQEILVQNQTEKEWQYGLTELAYHYDENSKKSKFVPLNKPSWMANISDNTIKKIKVRRDMLPYGVVVDLSQMGTFANESNTQDLSKLANP